MTQTEAPERDVDEGAGVRGRFGSFGSIGLLLTLAWAGGLASFPLNDNSFLTHLATGRLILDRGAVPASDPYTFTAAGEPWTVQSWLASVAYAAAERAGGIEGLRLLVLVVFAASVIVLWAVTRPARSLLVRLAIVSVCLFIATGLWTERPYMVGVIGLGLVWLALDGRIQAWWLLPFGWIWTNSHGSFPLAFVLVGTVVVGGALDRRAEGHGQFVTAAEKRTVGWLVGGVLLGAVGPVGPKILLFPFSAFGRSEIFAEIVEWRSPTWQEPSQLAYLVLAIAGLLLVARHRSWRLALPAFAFAAAGLYAQRNIVMAAVVLAAAASAAAPELGTLRVSDRPRLGPALALVLAMVSVLVAVSAVTAPGFGLGGYPARALAWIEEHERGRVATQIPAGNLLEALDGASGAVFFDDRVDMFPPEVFEDFLALDRGRPSWDAVLDTYGITLVVWERSEPLGSLVAASERWQVVYSDVDWVVARRRVDAGEGPTATSS